jgi:hypothetical protein
LRFERWQSIPRPAAHDDCGAIADVVLDNDGCFRIKPSNKLKLPEGQDNRAGAVHIGRDSNDRAEIKVCTKDRYMIALGAEQAGAENLDLRFRIAGAPCRCDSAGERACISFDFHG